VYSPSNKGGGSVAKENFIDSVCEAESIPPYLGWGAATYGRRPTLKQPSRSVATINHATQTVLDIDTVIIWQIVE